MRRRAKSMLLFIQSAGVVIINILHFGTGGHSVNVTVVLKHLLAVKTLCPMSQPKTLEPLTLIVTDCERCVTLNGINLR